MSGLRIVWPHGLPGVGTQRFWQSDRHFEPNVPFRRGVSDGHQAETPLNESAVVDISTRQIRRIPGNRLGRRPRIATLNADGIVPDQSAVGHPILRPNVTVGRIERIQRATVHVQVVGETFLDGGLFARAVRTRLFSPEDTRAQVQVLAADAEWGRAVAALRAEEQISGGRRPAEGPQPEF